MPDGSEPWTWWPRFGPADGIPTARQPSYHHWVPNTCQDIEMSIALPYHAWFVGHQTECLARIEHRRRGWRGRTWAAMLRPVVRIDFLRPLIGRRCGGCGRLNGGDHGWRNTDVAAAEECPLAYHRAEASA